MALNGLDTALSGLRIAQQQLGVISNNVANVGTQGYTRKILPQSTVAIAGESIGVRGEAITRYVDLSLERDFWTQVSEVSALDTKATYLNRVQEFHGPPEAEASISAALADLHDKFALLSDSPEDTFLQRTVVDQAGVYADKMNDLSDLLTEMRNDAQDEMSLAIQKTNDLLVRIADINKQVKFNIVSGKTTAAMEDIRDELIRELSNEMEISFFVRGDGVMVVQTSEGVELASERAESLYFDKGPVGPQSYYPNSIGGIYVGGDPVKNKVAIDITERDIGGRIGALVELRDEILPEQMAGLDELAHKVALRFQQQGLALFTDAAGAIPADTAPILDPPGPLTAVEYVGFSAEIQVNSLVLNDNTLIQTGTVATDQPVQSGSNEVIRRVVDFVFGEVDYQDAIGSIDVRATASGGVSMQDWLGLYSENQVTGTTDMSSYGSISALLTAGDDVFLPPAAPITDQFTITFEETRSAPPLGPTTITIDLSDAEANFPIGGAITSAADQIIAEINNQIVLAGVPAGLDAQARLSPYGQLIIESRGDITLDSSFVGGIRQEGLDFLGLTEGAYQTTDPWFEVQVGNDPAARITIDPGDTEVELQAKLEYNTVTQTGVPGLFVDVDVATGFLTVRPGNDDSNGGPVFGGDIKFLGGPFETTAVGGSGVPLNSTVIESLFGTADPINDILYSTTGAFRSQNLGPGVSRDTGLIGTTSITDYAQRLVNRQTEEIILIDAQKDDEQSFHDLLQRRLVDESGVNIDEELAQMIIIQTAYAAAARTVSTIDEMFRELLNSV